jgi:hypothetical protein
MGIILVPASEGLFVIRKSIGHPHQVQATSATGA